MGVLDEGVNALVIPMSTSLMLLAIDPGRAKCGLAVVQGPGPILCLERKIVETERLIMAVGETLKRRPEVQQVLLGNATHSATLRKALAAAFPAIPLELVDEWNTSVRAKARYVADNPAPGWRRLLPAGMRSPEVPYDDYAALLLAEDYFAKKMGI